MEATGASEFLRGLRAGGVDWVFCNAGTDFPPVIEALAAGGDYPRLVPILHENVAVGMAHGYYLATGRPQAAMVHVNVGTANAVMALVNAHRDQVPVLLAAGRTPLTEGGRPGSRTDAIHWGQDMFDQGGMVREVTKWDHELRDASAAADMVGRALAVAMAAPRGPVYLSLPRETLAAPVASPAGVSGAVPVPTAANPPPAVVAAVAARLAAASDPVIVTSRGSRELFEVLPAFADRFAVPVTQVRPAQLTMPTRHPLSTGTLPGPQLARADLVIVLDTAVPWLPGGPRPADDAYVVHVGADPLHSRIPVRTFATDLAVTAEPHLFAAALTAALAGYTPPPDRRGRLVEEIAAARAAEPDTAAARVSRAVSDVLGEGVVVSEIGARPAAMDLTRWDSYFGPPLSGGLGWGLPAALGVKLADPARLVVATVGDGSYVFANPSASHQAAATLGLGLLTVVFDNGRWESVRSSTARMYPDGAAVAAPEMPLTRLGPAPDYVRLVEAYGGHGAHVTDLDTLPAALKTARDRCLAGQQCLVAVSVP